MKASEFNLPKEKFVLANENKQLHDKELITKPKSYLRDAFDRFKKNKGSIVAAFIILILVLYAIIAPFTTNYTVSDQDTYYQACQPKLHLFEKTNFWDGCTKETLNQNQYIYYNSITEETGHVVFKKNKVDIQQKKTLNGKTAYTFNVRLDSYQKVGTVLLTSRTDAEYQAIQDYQNSTGIQVLYPITTPSLRPTSGNDGTDGNYWFKTEIVSEKTSPVVDINKSTGEVTYTNIYEPYNASKDTYNSSRIEGETPLYNYSYRNEGGLEIRVNYYEYYIYMHGYEPYFIFGTTALYGQDLFTCLASGARFSFVLAISVAIVNMFVGAIYGAIEGYYGGKADLIMERIVEILSAVPFMIVITLLKYHMSGTSNALLLFIAFFLTGWIGEAGTVRMQFYRFKNQEYVLAARTLGAKDRRIMFKHIFPNSLGTIVTSSVLVIPGMIFSETSLSYLGIINLSTGKMTSVGTLLANAQPWMTAHPYLMLFPSLFISLLMLSFNLFGNGLRDAFNPSLRGSEN